LPVKELFSSCFFKLVKFTDAPIQLYSLSGIRKWIPLKTKNGVCKCGGDFWYNYLFYNLIVNEF